ncbi:MAG: protein translocase subunit SecD [Clostridiales bacterium]|jgi:protein-export SecD/SecF family membrane protein|nr:protein translocase subunit SecD [Clostridiales bacterium]
MKAKSIGILVLLAAAAAGLCCLSFFGLGPDKLLGAANIKQGLDLKGGVNIVYEADKESPTREEMYSAIALIRGRLDNLNYTEAEVGQQGDNRIRVDIPGVADAETAIKEIGRTALLQFADEEGNVLLTGAQVVNAVKSAGTDPQNPNVTLPQVSLEFSEEGRQAFSEATKNNIGKPLYILLDDQVISAPTVQSQITENSAVITGSFTTKEAEDLAGLIKAGALPFNLNVISMNNVGARLGADSLNSGLLAGAIGFAMVFVFMIVMYKVSGAAAGLALIIYLGLELVLLSLMRVTLTLPGIAGIVLSVGMAVDANIIIFERLKEELRSGKTLRAALDAGYHRAFPAILDSNITTILAAAVLFWLGTGPVKGFAETLAIGVVLSMFTALVITRFIMKSLYGAGVVNPKLYGSK